MDEYHCFFDGACAPQNPGGHIGMGIVVYKGKAHIPGNLIHKDAKYRKPGAENTNNVAEYGALWYLLDYLYKEKLFNNPIHIFGDSKMVIQQMNGNWQIKDGAYRKGALTCQEYLRKFTNVKLWWIPREKNTFADNMSAAPLRYLGIQLFKDRKQ